MAASLEDRVRVLENFRYTALGRINACQTMAIGAWSHLCLNSDDPVALAEKLIAAWQRGTATTPHMPGVDPVHLDSVAQEYQAAIDDLGSSLLTFVRAEAAKLVRPRKSES